MYNSKIKLLTIIPLLKFDVKPEKFDCEKTELSGITDRSHKATVTRRPVTSFGHQGGRRIFWGRPKFYIDSMYENNGYAYNMSNSDVVEIVTFETETWLKFRDETETHKNSGTRDL